MTDGSLRGKAAVSLLALVFVGGWLVGPSVAHESNTIAHNWSKHYKRLAKRIFYTKGVSNTRFINVGEQVSDAALLDGLDSTAFAEAAHTHTGADITSGTVDEGVIDVLIARVADVFDIVLAADGTGSGLDADLLDGRSSADFAPAGQSMSIQWFKEAADGLGSTTTAERVVFTAPEDITITNVFLEPAAALVASDTNFATITLARRAADGTGQVTVASETTATAGAGGSGSWTAFSAVSLGSLNNTSVAAGEKLTIAIAKSGVGVAVPIMVVQIEYTID